MQSLVSYSGEPPRSTGLFQGKREDWHSIPEGFLVPPHSFGVRWCLVPPIRRYQETLEKPRQKQQRVLACIKQGALLLMDEILHHLRNPGRIILRKYQQTMLSHGFFYWCKTDFVHPQSQQIMAREVARLRRHPFGCFLAP